MDHAASTISHRIRLAREGRDDLLGELLDAQRNYLRVLAASALHRDVRGKADASDVVQETLLKAHQRFGQFRGDTEREWVGWLRQILIHNVTDLHRRHSVAAHEAGHEISLGQAVERSSHLLRSLAAASGPSPSRIAEDRELGVVLADALAKLDPADSEIVILRNLEDLSWNEIGERTQRSPDAARMRWTRALQQLGTMLKEQAP